MIVAIIPARSASARLPGKVLADIGGAPMVVRVWERVFAARGVDAVYVATDDDAVAQAVLAHGGRVLRTGPASNGTLRVAAAAASLSPAPTVVVNVQGDEPFVEPSLVTDLADAVVRGAAIATASAPLDAAEASKASRVKVVTDASGRALYFSRAPIPTRGPYRVHVGVYAFEARTLARVAALAPSPLEQAEQLEQLRWLEAGVPIQVLTVADAGLAVDTADDLQRARARWAGASTLVGCS